VNNSKLIKKKMFIVFNFRKLFLLSASSLIIFLNAFAYTSQICDFDPARDTQPIIDIFNKNHHMLSPDDDSSLYQSILESCYKNPRCTIKVLLENEKLAGYIRYQKIGRHGSIEELAVEDNFRNKEYGALLLSTAIEEFNDMPYIQLACYKNNAPALHLYQKMGFKKEKTVEDDDITLLRRKN